MFITFEGIDGSGKSTQIELLKSYFEENGQKVVMLREPGGTNFSEEIRKILLHTTEKLSPVSELFLFNAARANLVETIIRPALKEKIIVICDRFLDSTTAYQGYGRGLPLDKVRESNMLATGGMKPDLTFYIHIPLEISKKRNNDKNPDRMERSGDEFFSKVIDGFVALAGLEPGRIKMIDGTGTVEETHKNIIEIIEG